MERNIYEIERQHSITYDKLNQANKRTQSKKNRDLIDYIIDVARINANDTLTEDKNVRDDQWDQMFVGSIGTMLCTGEYDRHVCGFFEKQGIRW